MGSNPSSTTKMDLESYCENKQVQAITNDQTLEGKTKAKRFNSTNFSSDSQLLWNVS